MTNVMNNLDALMKAAEYLKSKGIEVPTKNCKAELDYNGRMHVSFSEEFPDNDLQITEVKVTFPK